MHGFEAIMRIISGLFLAAAIAFGATGAGAKEISGPKPLGVVELFTSQGCSSCPPADAVLGQLAKRSDVVALGYHVDYWDYLGWRDTFGSRAFTDRQYGYASSFGSRSVYTPQAIVNGRADYNGGDGGSINAALRSMSRKGMGMTANVSVRQEKNSVFVEVSGTNPGREVHVTVVSYAKAEPVRIQRGENTGRSIVYANPVTRIDTIGMWHGGRQRFELPETEMMKYASGGCAILLQSVTSSGKPSAIIGAAVVPTRK
jgi:hypothetical protein